MIRADARPSLFNVYLVDAVCTAFALVYALLNKDAPSIVTLFVDIAPVVAVVGWFSRYLRVTRLSVPYDVGFFLWIGWPVLIPVYARRMRGWRGLVLACGLFGLIVAPTLVAAVVRIALHPDFTP